MPTDTAPRRRRAALILAVCALLAGAAACSDDDPAAEPDETTTSAGESTTTSPGAETTSTAPDATTTTVAEAEIVLRGDGLGVVELGADPDTAVAAVSAALGDPSADTDWQPSFSTYGTCPGENIRGVEWGALVLLFTDGETSYGSDPHLFSWRLTGAPPPLATAKGFGFQATAADAEDLYPGAVESVPAEEPFPAFLEIEVEGGPITAFLDDEDRVTNIEAGVPCGE